MARKMAAGFFASHVKTAQLGTQRAYAQRTAFGSFRCMNQELFLDEMKILSRMGKQQFTEQ